MVAGAQLPPEDAEDPGGEAWDEALMAALLDEPLPPGAAADPERVAAHRAALADLSALRTRMHLLGDALGEAPDRPADRPARAAGGAPGGRPRTRGGSRRPPGRRAVRVGRGPALAVTACVAALVLGAGWLTGGGLTGGSVHDKSAVPEAVEAPAAREQRSAGDLLACARRVAEGTVTRSVPRPDGTGARVTLEVSHSYKPRRGPARLAFEAERERGAVPQVGQRVLVFLPEDGAGDPAHWVTGVELVRARAALTGAADGGCG
ncbi:hypothetical protein [Streptomyces sp. NPDC002490]|uniref:hypothetical protein n=1 Tax=Streptomyces sp. NPDC002490 TaxID=3154416 RepID=UPI00332DA8D1